MSQIHAQLAASEPKKYSDPMAMKSGSATDPVTMSKMKISPSSAPGFYQPSRNSAVPQAERGSHAFSAAAHLSASAQPHSKPAANQQGINPAALREPPSFIERAGKQHR